jgi:glycosyltransferase involved in cell wall biosynthesis
MRLVFLQGAFWPSVGGIEVLSQRALEALSERGYEPSVITTFAGKELPERDEVQGIRVYRLPFRRALENRDLELVIHCRKELASLKRELRPDLIQINFSGPSGYFLLGTAEPGDPPIVMAVRHPVDRMTNRQDSLVCRLLSASTWVTGNSRSTLEQTIAAAPEIESRASVILNGLQVPETRPTRPSFDPPELLCLGRLVFDKGFHVAVEAFSTVRKRFPEARLTIAGDGPERSALETQARALGLEPAVRFTGLLSPEGVPAAMNEASLVLMPSREESFGLVALEAGLMGRPVVASDVGGLPEVVRHGVTGWTVPRDDAEALAEAAIQCISDPDTALRYGEAARRRALVTFSLERYVDQYEALYRRLAGSRTGRKKAG